MKLRSSSWHFALINTTQTSTRPLASLAEPVLVQRAGVMMFTPQCKQTAAGEQSCELTPFSRLLLQHDARRLQRPVAPPQPDKQPAFTAYILVSWQVGVTVLVTAQFLFFRRYFFSRLGGRLGHVLIFPHFGSNSASSAPPPQGLLGNGVHAGSAAFTTFHSNPAVNSSYFYTYT